MSIDEDVISKEDLGVYTEALERNGFHASWVLPSIIFLRDNNGLHAYKRHRFPPEIRSNNLG
jgi:hypothetical protein